MSNVSFIDLIIFHFWYTDVFLTVNTRGRMYSSVWNCCHHSCKTGSNMKKCIHTEGNNLYQWNRRDSTTPFCDRFGLKETLMIVIKSKRSSRKRLLAILWNLNEIQWCVARTGTMTSCWCSLLSSSHLNVPSCWFLPPFDLGQGLRDCQITERSYNKPGKARCSGENAEEVCGCFGSLLQFLRSLYRFFLSSNTYCSGLSLQQG